MYKSPIELITDNIINEINEKMDKYILECVQKCGIVIDEEELLKALQYDREQYFKGYKEGHKDGVYDAQPHWKPCRNIENLPDNEVICCDKYGEQMIGYLAYDDNGELVCAFEDMLMVEPIAWMSLPEPYKEKEQ